MTQGLRWTMLVVTFALLSGCASFEPKAWQRGDLARPEMAWDPDPLDAAMREHTHNSKEAAAGSATVAGGGCGCN